MIGYEITLMRLRVIEVHRICLQWDFKSLVSTNFTISALKFPTGHLKFILNDYINGGKVEASTRFELVHDGFADRSLTAWVRRLKKSPPSFV